MKTTLFLLCSLFIASHLLAQSPVIRVEKGDRLNIAIYAQGKVSEILKNNFSLSGATNPTGANQADYVLTASETAGGIQGILKTQSGTVQLSETFSGEQRDACHALTDAVIKKLTGQPGIATSQVAFVSTHSGNKELYIMDIDGYRVRQITKDKSIALGPKFSPDGTRIAFTSYKSGYPDVWVVNLTRSKKQAIAFFPGVNSGASFSPTGTQLALTLSKDGNTDLYIMPAGGGEPRRLIRTRGTEATPTWSPDGKQIAFISDTRGAPQLFISPTKGGAMKRIQTFSSYTTEPNWSPDGKKIAYSLMTAGQNQIAFTDLTTQKQVILTTGGNNESPSWTRDSRHLAFAKNGQLYLVDSLTRETTQLTRNISSCTEPNVSR